MIPRSFIDVLPEFCIFGICLPLHIMQCGFKETAWSRHPWPWGRRADPAVEPRALPILKLQHHEMKRSETVEGHLAKLKREARSRSTNLASTRSQLPAEVRIERMLLPVSRCGLSKSPRGSLILSARDASPVHGHWQERLLQLFVTPLARTKSLCRVSAPCGFTHTL